jgi:hypothetical protein
MVKQRWLPREQPSTIGCKGREIRWSIKHASQCKARMRLGRVGVSFLFFIFHKRTTQLGAQQRRRSGRRRRFCGHEEGLVVGRQSIRMGCYRRARREKCSGRMGALEQILMAVDANRSPSKAHAWLQDAWDICSGFRSGSLILAVTGQKGRALRQCDSVCAD